MNTTSRTSYLKRGVGLLLINSQYLDWAIALLEELIVLR